MLTQQQIDEADKALGFQPKLSQNPTNSSGGLRGKALFDSIDQKTPQMGLLQDQSSSQGATGFGALDTLDKGISSVLKPAGEFMFGTSAKTIGNVLGAGVEAAGNLITGKNMSTNPEDNKTGVFTKGLDQQFGSTEAAITGRPQVKGTAPISNALMTGLELYPGGGYLTKTLKSLPGGAKVAEIISNSLKFIPEKLKEKAVKQYAQMLAPTTNEMKALTMKVAPEAVDRGIISTNLPNLAQEAENKASQFGMAIDAAWEKVPENARVPTKEVIDKLQTLKTNFSVDGKVVKPEAARPIDSMISLINELATEKPLGGSVMGSEQTGSITAKNIRKLRQILDTSVDLSKGFTKDEMANFTKATEKEAANAIRGLLNNSYPDINALNKEFTFWSRLHDIASASAQRTVAQGPGLGTQIIKGAGFVAGAATGGGITSAVGWATVASQVDQLAKSTLWKSVSSVAKNKLANLLAKGDLTSALRIINGITNVSKSKDGN